jgi:hypothetical protein
VGFLGRISKIAAKKDINRAGDSPLGQYEGLLFDVISQAYENHSLMLTTNLGFEEWP